MDTQFTMKSVHELEDRGVISWKDFDKQKMQLADTVEIEVSDLTESDSFIEVLEKWTEGRAKLRPTWRHLLWAVREIKLDHIADQIEHY